MLRLSYPQLPKLRSEAISNVIETFSPLQELIESGSNALVAGGFPTGLLLGEIKGKSIVPKYLNDLDVYPTSLEEVRSLERFFLDKGYNLIKETPLAMTLAHPEALKEVVQLISPINNQSWTPKAIIDTFDFVNCSCVFDSLTRNFFVHDDFPVCTKEKTLKINNPWMIYEVLASEAISNDIRHRFIVQITRIIKYQLRYSLTLHASTRDLLLKIKAKFPEIESTSERGLVYIGESVPDGTDITEDFEHVTPHDLNASGGGGFLRIPNGKNFWNLFELND